MEERSRSKRRASLERQKKPPEIIERKVDSSEERDWLSKNGMKLRLKLRQEIGRREILTSLFHEINQEFESQRFQVQQAIRWADQAQRDKMSLYGQLELRNRLFQEDHARDCQEIEELRRICCEETD